jgi:hypothetical protein
VETGNTTWRGLTANISGRGAHTHRGREMQGRRCGDAEI